MRWNATFSYRWVHNDLSPRRRLILIYAELGDGRIGAGQDITPLAAFIQTSEQKTTRLLNEMTEAGLLVYGPCHPMGQNAWALPKVGLGK